MAVRARVATVCFSCGQGIEVKDEIDWYIDVDETRWWGHPLCVELTWDAGR